MTRTDRAIGAIILLVSVTAAAALVVTAQGRPPAATEATRAAIAPAVQAEPGVAVAGPMPNAESEALRGEDAAAGTPPPEADTPAAGGTPVDSADAAIAIALRDEATVKVAMSTHAVRTTPEGAFGGEGLLAASGDSPPLVGPSTDGVWLVGVTGEIRNSYGATAVPLDWMIFVIDARTGSIVSTWGDTGTLPDIFD